VEDNIEAVQANITSILSVYTITHTVSLIHLNDCISLSIQRCVLAYIIFNLFSEAITFPIHYSFSMHNGSGLHIIKDNMLVITHTDNSHGCKAFSGVCDSCLKRLAASVILSVSLYDKTENG